MRKLKVGSKFRDACVLMKGGSQWNGRWQCVAHSRAHCPQQQRALDTTMGSRSFLKKVTCLGLQRQREVMGLYSQNCPCSSRILVSHIVEGISMKG